MITVEILPDRKEIKEITRKTQPGRVLGYKQEAYAHIPGEHYPIKCFIRVNSPLADGKHQINLPMQIGKYGDLEINPFSEVEVIDKNKLKAAG